MRPREHEVLESCQRIFPLFNYIIINKYINLIPEYFCCGYYAQSLNDFTMWDTLQEELCILAQNFGILNALLFANRVQ